MSAPTLVTLGLNEPISTTLDNTIPYDDLVTSVNTFGRVYLPSVYGKNLTSFEVASSGKIVLSLNDRHAMDVIEADGMVALQPATDNSLEMSLSNDVAHVRLDAGGEYVDIAAVSAVYINSGESVELSTGDGLATLSMFSSNVYLTSTGTLALATGNQQAYVSIDTTSNNVNIFSSNDCTIYSQHDVIIKANAMHIYVEEFDLTYSFKPTNNGSLGLHQTVPDPITGIKSSVQVARFGIPQVL